MATTPRPWPTDAAVHRDRAAEEDESAKRLLMKVLADDRVTPEEFRELGLALGHIQESELHLVHVGAQIEPQ